LAVAAVVESMTEARELQLHLAVAQEVIAAMAQMEQRLPAAAVVVVGTTPALLVEMVDQA
jgi:hypothetical protein